MASLLFSYVCLHCVPLLRTAAIGFRALTENQRWFQLKIHLLHLKDFCFCKLTHSHSLLGVWHEHVYYSTHYSSIVFRLLFFCVLAWIISIECFYFNFIDLASTVYFALHLIYEFFHLKFIFFSLEFLYSFICCIIVISSFFMFIFYFKFLSIFIKVVLNSLSDDSLILFWCLYLEVFGWL